jgi:hypothetical protein
MKSADVSSPAGCPITTTWLRRSLPGLSSTGFIATSGRTPAATAWIHCARPISPPSTTMLLFDMFWALNGATRIPRRANARHRAVVTTDFPASDVVPAIRRDPLIRPD